MATTVLFIEHLITGIQSGVWIGLIILTYFGTEWVQLDSIKSFGMVGVFLALSFLYPLGIFVDNLADGAFKRWSKDIRDRTMRTESLDGISPAMEILKGADKEFIMAYISYIRTRVRISRSAALNFGLITLSATVFTVVRLHDLPKPQFLRLLGFEIVTGAAITVLALLSWHSITATFAKRVVQASMIYGTECARAGSVNESQTNTDISEGT